MSENTAVMGRPKKPELTVQVRITETAARKGRAVSAALGMDFPDWLTEVVLKAADEQQAAISDLFRNGQPKKTGKRSDD